METLRLVPSVNSIPKLVARDTSVVAHTIPTKSGQEPVPVTVPLPEGTSVRFDVTAMALDRESRWGRGALRGVERGLLTRGRASAAAYWGEDASEFKPSRFIDTNDYKWPRDAFLAFSAGPRICIGRQAAIVEATAFIARIVAKFRVEAPAGEAAKWKRKVGGSEMDRRQRIYKVRNGQQVYLQDRNLTLWLLVF